MQQTDKPVALISGATRGIGRATALLAAEHGYDIAFCYRSQRSLADEMHHALEEHGASVFSQQLDITEESEVEQYFNAVENRFGRLDLLVNNAGQSKDGLLATLQTQDIRDMLNTNVLGTMLFCRSALTLMLPARRGSIVNISSVSASRPNRGQSGYAAAKGAVEAFTRALAVELASKGIRVNCVAPGVIKTDMAGELLKRHEAAIMQRLLAKKLGEPDDIARAVMFLADPANHYISGETVHINGGLTLS